MNILRMITAPTIRNQRELSRYVAMGTIVAVAMALSADVVNQLVFFEGWPATIRSWSITVGLASVIAVVMLSFIGRSNLALHQTKMELEALSRTDPLTGLANRRALLDEAELSAAKLMVLVIFDVDHFKRVNDTFGHRAGDIVLKVIGGTIATELADFGTVGRIGGEEFALVSIDGSPKSLVTALHRLCDKVASTPIVADGQAVTVSLSAGAAMRLDEPLNALYVKADRALYRAKAAGRNRVCLSPELAAEVGQAQHAEALIDTHAVGENWANRAGSSRMWRD